MGFGQIDASAVQEHNAKVDEMYGTKPPSNEPPPVPESNSEKTKNAIGNVLAITGNVTLLIGGMGAAMIAFAWITAAFGLSSLLTVLVLIAIGVLLYLIAGRMISTHWIPQMTGGLI